MIVSEVLQVSLRDWPLHKRSSNRVGPIQHNHFNIGLRSGLQQISQRSFVRIKARAGILDIHYHRVQLLEHVNWWTTLRFRVAIHAIYWNAGRAIDRVIDLARIISSKNSVLRTEDGGQLDSGSRGQKIDCAFTLRIESRLIREQADGHLLLALLKLSEITLLQDIDTGQDMPVARRDMPRRCEGFVVAGDGQQLVPTGICDF